MRGPRPNVAAWRRQNHPSDGDGAPGGSPASPHLATFPSLLLLCAISQFKLALCMECFVPGDVVLPTKNV